MIQLFALAVIPPASKQLVQRESNDHTSAPSMAFLTLLILIVALDVIVSLGSSPVFNDAEVFLSTFPVDSACACPSDAICISLFTGCRVSTSSGHRFPHAFLPSLSCFPAGDDVEGDMPSASREATDCFALSGTDVVVFLEDKAASIFPRRSLTRLVGRADCGLLHQSQFHGSKGSPVAGSEEHGARCIGKIEYITRPW